MREVWSNRKSKKPSRCDSEQQHTQSQDAATGWETGCACFCFFYLFFCSSIWLNVAPIFLCSCYSFMSVSVCEVVWVCPSQLRASLAKARFCSNLDSTVTVSLDLTRPDWARNGLLLISDQRNLRVDLMGCKVKIKGRKKNKKQMRASLFAAGMWCQQSRM